LFKRNFTRDVLRSSIGDEMLVVVQDYTNAGNKPKNFKQVDCVVRSRTMTRTFHKFLHPTYSVLTN
jgi:hypothetical protein